MDKEEMLELIEEFISYAEREAVIDEDMSEELSRFAKYYVRNIAS